MKVYLTPEEVERMAQAATCVRDEVLIRMLFWLSCRVSEALGIRVEDVNPISSFSFSSSGISLPGMLFA